MRHRWFARYIEVGRFHLGTLPQWRWKLYNGGGCCHYSVWLQWLCFEFAIGAEKSE